MASYSGDGKEWQSGYIKKPVEGRIRVSVTGLEGDEQADIRNHGGPDKAVLVYPESHYQKWQEELHIEKLDYGSFGENITISNLTEEDVCIGDVFEIGDVKLQISQPRQPCWKISKILKKDGLDKRVQETGHTGWYLRVLQEGEIESDNEFKLIGRLFPQWTVLKALRIMENAKNNPKVAGELASCLLLSESWKKTLRSFADGKNSQSKDDRFKGP
ncbi:MAG: MOSC domain-containing protein [Candidatus Schekmanbacteria bacterium]|nr:MAG: MOSC domain-containing protein [Candidatus Schekmanbacteria bacterium]